MSMFAARDQENFINIQQQAAASKPLNQGLQALQPKTPGNRALQKSSRGRLNDENATRAIKGGKDGIKIDGLGKAAAQTPAPQTQARNALAPKTTNAKAKALQTPGPLGLKPEGPLKTNRRPTSLRKNKVHNDRAQSNKLQIPIDVEGCESPEIEAIHPRPPDMEDIDDDIPPIDLSIFQPEKGGIDPDDLPGLMVRYHAHAKGPDGLTFLERKAKKDQERDNILELREQAAMLRAVESDLEACLHDPECEAGECKDWPEQLRCAEEKYRATLATLPLPNQSNPAKSVNSKPAKTFGNGPSDAASKRAATTLSMRPKTPVFSDQARLGSREYAKPWLAGSKASDVPANQKGRHAAAVAASRTTLGFQKGRSASRKLYVELPIDEQGRQIGSKPPPNLRKSDIETLEELFKENEERKAEEVGDLALDVNDSLDEDARQDYVLDL